MEIKVLNFLLKLFILTLIFTISTVQGSKVPKKGQDWNWIISETVTNSRIKKINVPVIDIDLFDTSKKTIDSLHKKNITVVCYFSAGTYENWRSDSKDMKKIKGLLRTKVSGWEDEKWLDFRIEGIKNIMTNRLKMAKEKECDSVEFDNVDAYENVNWKDRLSIDDQIKYNIWLAKKAHEYNLGAGLKNAVDLLSNSMVIENFDFAINEDCYLYNECNKYADFINSNKAVLAAFYSENRKLSINLKKKICKQTQSLEMSIIIKDDLDFQYKKFDKNVYC